MESIKINSNLFPIISVGMYCTNLEPESVFSDYLINEDFEENASQYNAEQFWDNFDNQKYIQTVQSLASDYLDGEIINENGDKVAIECGEIYSPKYYNFATDEIEFTVTYNKADILKSATKDKENFNKFLKEKYSSYDGFYSFTSNNFEEWEIDFLENIETAVGAVLSYLFKDEEQNFEEYFFENVPYYDEFYKY